LLDEKKLKDTAIDEFYGEDIDKSDESIKSSNEYIKFNEKVKAAAEKLELLDESNQDFDIDVFSIIDKAEGIKEKKKSRIEFVLFIVTASIILSIYMFAGIYLGVKVIMISQIVIITLMPWCLIPAAVVKQKRGDI
jgi:hypothetical protein